jgi:hypothetical protein
MIDYMNIILCMLFCGHTYAIKEPLLDSVGQADCNLAGVHPLHLLTFQRDQKQNIMEKFFCGELSCFHLRMPDLEPRFQNSTFHHSLALVAQWLVI